MNLVCLTYLLLRLFTYTKSYLTLQACTGYLGVCSCTLSSLHVELVAHPWSLQKTGDNANLA